MSKTFSEQPRRHKIAFTLSKHDPEEDAEDAQQNKEDVFGTTPFWESEHGILRRNQMMHRAMEFGLRHLFSAGESAIEMIAILPGKEWVIFDYAIGRRNTVANIKESDLKTVLFAALGLQAPPESASLSLFQPGDMEEGDDQISEAVERRTIPVRSTRKLTAG